MAAGPKEVAGRRDSLPAQEIAADPLQSYCPDLDQWPRSWAYEARDIPYGLQMVECFKPFLREMLALPLSRTTLRRHRDNIWVLGGEVIRRVQMDSGLRRRPVEQVVLDLIGDDGGPLLSHGESETEQRSFDASDPHGRGTIGRAVRCVAASNSSAPAWATGVKRAARYTRACHQLSQTTLATSWTAARKFRAVFS